MTTQSVILCQTSFVGVSASASVPWPGGRSAVTVVATAFGVGSINLQILGMDNSTWINVNSTFLSNQLYLFDAPPGQYRMNNAASSAIGVNAALVRIPY